MYISLCFQLYSPVKFCKSIPIQTWMVEVGGVCELTPMLYSKTVDKKYWNQVWGDPINICIIPARSGSKRIPQKNIRAFCGTPIIGYAIKAALESQLFDHVLVSTDDDQIAEVAISMGAQTPFIRPAALSDDHCATLPVIQHAITWAQSNWGSLDYVCTLYATAPFVTSHVLTAAYQQLIEQPQKEYAFGVCPFPSPIQRAFR